MRYSQEQNRKIKKTQIERLNYASKSILPFLIIWVLFFLYSNAPLSAGNLPFQDTEKLEFSLRWRGIIGGKSTIDFQEVPLPGLGQKSYLFHAKLRTVGLADFLFKIKNEYSTLVIMDLKEILPVWWKVKQREKNYKYEEKTDFEELIKKEPDLQNPLSALSLIRSKKWEVGESFIVPVLVQKKTYPVKVQAISRESLKVYGKIFDTILIDVVMEDVKVDISSAKIKDFKIWLSNDYRKIPILMKAETSVGPITVLLDNREELMK